MIDVVKWKEEKGEKVEIGRKIEGEIIDHLLVIEDIQEEWEEIEIEVIDEGFKYILHYYY